MNSCLSIQAPYAYVFVCLFVSERSFSYVRVYLLCVLYVCVYARCSMDFDFILTTTLPDWYVFVSFHVELYEMRLMWDCDSFFFVFFSFVFFSRFVFNSYCDSVIVNSFDVILRYLYSVILPLFFSFSLSLHGDLNQIKLLDASEKIGC